MRDMIAEGEAEPPMCADCRDSPTADAAKHVAQRLRFAGAGIVRMRREQKGS